MSDIVPDNEPFLLSGGETGCMLLHGFTAMPEEMRPLGEYLASNGYTVLGVRLAGHATQPSDLGGVRWRDWLDDVRVGISVLSKTCSKLVLIGQSLGGMIALIGAARYNPTAVITLSTPYRTPPSEKLADWLLRIIQPMIHKDIPRFPPDHPLYHRRELNYPAYPEFPSRILPELDKLAVEMVKELPHVSVPVLMMHSRDDRDVTFSSMQSIYDHLGSQQKEMHPVEGMNHSLVMDPRRNEVFEVILKFLSDFGQGT